MSHRRCRRGAPDRSAQTPPALLPLGVLLVTLAGGLAACGKEGPPLPPPSRAPAAGEDLTVHQRGRELILEMAYPRTTVSGLALGDLTAIEVWELERPPTPAGEAPPIQPAELAGAEPRVILRGPELAGTIAGDRFVLRLLWEPGELESPTAHLFALRTVAEPGQTSAFSNVAGIVPALPPAPPADLAVRAGPDGVELLWAYDPAASLVGFRVYRRGVRSRFYGPPLATVPATERAHRDETARFGERYIYALTAVARELPLLESDLASEQEIDYADRFPPPPPENLVALPEPGRVRLIWDASAARDVTGYQVERRPAAGEFTVITQEPVVATEHIDREVGVGSFEYRVHALDAAGNRGEPSDPVTAEVGPPA